MSRFEVIDSELTYKGISYIVCTQYHAAGFEAELEALCFDAFERGAKRVCFACRDARFNPAPNGFSAGRFGFSFYSDFFMMSKRLVCRFDLPALRTLRLTPARERLYADIYNAAFSGVPNARTMDEAQLDRIRSSHDTLAGLFLHEGMPCGIYELTLGGTPEIAAIGIAPEFRRQGLGRRALGTLERMLLAKGCNGVTLLVASQNLPALRLYEPAGYERGEIVSRWYEAGLPDE